MKPTTPPVALQLRDVPAAYLEQLACFQRPPRSVTDLRAASWKSYLVRVPTTQFKEETMLVHPVTVPARGPDRGRCWVDDVPVVPVDRFLAYLTDIGRSPNTVKAYAFDLKNYWEFISFRGLD